MSELVEPDSLYGIVCSFKGEIFAKQFVEQVEIIDKIRVDFSKYVYDMAVAMKKIAEFSQERNWVELHKNADEFMKLYTFIFKELDFLPDEQKKRTDCLIEDLILTK